MNTEQSAKTTLPSDLKVRAISGTVLVLIAATELYIGGSFFTAFVALLAAGMVREALRLTGVRRRETWILATIIGAAAILLLMPVLELGRTGILTSWTLIVATLVIAWLGAEKRRAMPFGMIACASVLIGCLVVVLSEQFAHEFEVAPLLLLIPSVIGTDIGAYFTGRALGGPKLAPRISPNKTWSGATGGVAGAIFLTGVCLSVMHSADWIELLVSHIGIVILLSVCSQIGDLAESWLKRRAGQKDSGRLIPGHGGLLDRFDGFMGASVLGLAPWFLFQFWPS